MSDLGELQVSVTADISDLKAEMASGGVAVGNFTNVSSAYAKQLQTSFTNLSASSTRNLNTLKDELKVLKESLFNETDINKIAFFNREIEDTKSTLQELQSVGLESTSKLSGALGRLTNPASLATTAVSRIRREFVGLALSFAGGELIGPLIQLVASLFEVDKATKQIQDDQAKFAESLKQAGAGAISSGTQLQAFINVAKDSLLPLAQRNEALKEANDLLGKHGQVLTLVNVGTAAVTEEVNKLTSALIAQAIAAKLSDRIAQIYLNQIDAVDRYNKAVQNLTKAQKDNQDLAKLNNDITLAGAGNGLGGGGAAVFNNVALTKALEEAKAATKNYRDVNDDLRKTTGSLNDETLKSTQLFGELGEHSDKAGKKIKTIADILAELQRQLQALDREGIVLNIDEAQNKISAIKSTISELVKSRGLNASNPIIISLIAQIKGIDDADLPVRIAKIFKYVTSQISLLNSEEINFKTDEAQAKIAVLKTAMKDLVDKQGLSVNSPEVKTLTQSINTLQAQENVEKVTATIKKLEDEIAVLDKIGVLTDTSKTKQEVALIQTAIEDLIKTGTDPNNNVLKALFKQVDTFKSVETIEDISTALKNLEKSKDIIGKESVVLRTDSLPPTISAIESTIKELLKLGLTAKDPVIVKLIAELDADKTKEDFANLVKSLSVDIQNTLDKTFEGLGSSIGKALATGGNVASAAFQSLFQTIGTGLQQMGDALIVYGIGIQALETAIKNPFLAIAAGIGLEIVGAELQNYVPKFATGVQNFGGGIALVGERGPELVNLPRGSDVIPNHALGSIGGTSQSLQVFGQTITKGADIVTIYDRGVLTRKRNYRG